MASRNCKATYTILIYDPNDDILTLPPKKESNLDMHNLYEEHCTQHLLRNITPKICPTPHFYAPCLDPHLFPFLQRTDPT